MDWLCQNLKRWTREMPSNTASRVLVYSQEPGYYWYEGIFEVRRINNTMRLYDDRGNAIEDYENLFWMEIPTRIKPRDGLAVI